MPGCQFPGPAHIVGNGNCGHLERPGILHRDRLLDFLDNPDDFRLLLAAPEVVGQVQAQFRDQGQSLFRIDALAAMVAAVHTGVRVTGGETGFRFQPPVIAEPPGVTREKARTVEVTLQPVVPYRGIQAEGELDVADVEMRIDEVETDEPALIGTVGPEPEFRDDGEIAPVTRILHHFHVPGNEARPGFQPGVGSDGEPPRERDFQAQVRFRCRQPDQVRTKRRTRSTERVGRDLGRPAGPLSGHCHQEDGHCCRPYTMDANLHDFPF